MKSSFDGLDTLISLRLVTITKSLKKYLENMEDRHVSAVFFQSVYLDFLPFSRSIYVVDIATSKQ